MHSPTSASASPQFLPTSRTSQAQKSKWRWRMRSAARTRRATRSATGDVAPGGESELRGVYGGVGLFGCGCVMNADDLGGIRGVYGLESFGSLEVGATDDEVVGMAELGAGAVEGLLHGALVLRGGEVGEGLVAEGRKGRVSHPYSLCEVLRSCAYGEGLRTGGESRMRERGVCADGECLAWEGAG